MSRPTDKKGLLELSRTNFNKFLELIDGLPDDIKTKEFQNDELNDRDKTIADVILPFARMAFDDGKLV